MTELLAKYEPLRTRLMASPSATRDPITEAEANDLFAYATISGRKTVRAGTAGVKIGRIFGINLTSNRITPYRAASMLAILEFFGDRDWNNADTRRTVFEEILALAGTDPKNMAGLLREFRPSNDDLAPALMAKLTPHIGKVLSLDDIGTITVKLRQLGFVDINDPRDIILYLIEGQTAYSATVLKARLGVKGPFGEAERKAALKKLLELSIDELRKLDTSIAGYPPKQTQNLPGEAAPQSAMPSHAPDATVQAAVRGKILALDLTKKPNALIRYFSNPDNVQNVSHAVAKLKELLGYKGNFTAEKREAVWQMLVQLEAAEIRSPDKRKAWLEKALRGEVNGITEIHHPFIRQIMPRDGAPAASNPGPGQGAPTPAGVSANAGAVSGTGNTGKSGPAGNPGSSAGNSGLGGEGKPDPLSGTIGGSQTFSGRLPIPPGIDDRSPIKRSHDAFLAKAAARNAKAAQRPAELEPDYLERFFDSFGFTFRAPVVKPVALGESARPVDPAKKAGADAAKVKCDQARLYIQSVMECMELVLTHANGGETPSPIEVLSATILVVDNHNVRFGDRDALLRTKLQSAFKYMPPGASWILHQIEDVGNTVLENIFAIDGKYSDQTQLPYAQKWCSRQTPQVDWREFLTGAMIAAHPHAASGPHASAGSKGLIWPTARPAFFPVISDAFQRYLDDPIARAKKAAPIAPAQTPASTSTPAPIQPSDSRGGGASTADFLRVIMERSKRREMGG